MPFGIGGDKKRRQADDRHYQEEMAIVSESRPQYPSREDMYNSLGSSIYMVLHPEVDAKIMKNPLTKDMYAAFSFLNRLTKHGQRQSELLDLEYRALTQIAELNMDEDLFESRGWQTLKALEIYAQGIVSDSHKGFKAEIITTQLKTIRTELAEQERKKWLGVF